MAPGPSGKAKVCNTSITSSNLVGAFEDNKKSRSFIDLDFFLPSIVKNYTFLKKRPCYFLKFLWIMVEEGEKKEYKSQ